MRDKQTYLDIKALYPDHIVFVQSPMWVGKYETYGTDAAIARRFAWYARNLTDSDTLIVSDTHMRNELIRDLVGAGYHVAVVDKFEPKGDVTSDMDDSAEFKVIGHIGPDSEGYKTPVENSLWRLKDLEVKEDGND